MDVKPPPSGPTENPVSPRFQVRLPGFVSHESIGFGDAIKRVTTAVGIAPCSACERRARALNALVGIRGSQRPPS